MKEFKVNDHITLKLEDGRTHIYINGVKSKRSIGLFLNIANVEVMKHDHIELVDQAVEGFKSYVNKSLINNYDDNPIPSREVYNITAEQEFWAHCSNIQVWVEHDYDMSLIHSTLGFKLLKSLSNHGIQPAKERYKNEIVKRFRVGHMESSLFLLKNNFLYRFRKEQRMQFFLKNNPKLRLSIEKFLEEFNPEVPYEFARKPIIELLKELVAIGDQEARSILNNILQKLKSKTPKLLPVKDFWRIIEKSNRESKGFSWEQERILIEDLKKLSVDEIYCFDSLFAFFTGSLYREELLFELLREFDLYISDDVWEYRRGHIVALGKEAYEMAIFNIDEFVKTLKTGIYGDPESIRHEFWGASSKAFKEKTGIYALSIEELISDDFFKKFDKLHRRLNKKYSIIRK